MSAGSSCSEIKLYPRYVAKKRGSVVRFYCYSDYPTIMTWFRKQEKETPQELSEEEGHISKIHNGSLHVLTIQNIQFEDNGIYFCKQQCSRDSEDAWSCGSELKVLGVCQVDLCSRSRPHPRPCLPGEVAMALEFPGSG